MSQPLSIETLEHTLEVLEACEGSRGRAAMILGIGLPALRNRILLLDRHGYKIPKPAKISDYGFTQDEGPELVIKGTSVLSKNGVEVARWDKTRQRGRPDEEVAHIPDPKTITKISTLYDQSGEVVHQWVAEKPSDVARTLLWEEAAKALAEQLPAIEPLPEPQETLSKNLMTLLPVGDHHFGMLAWKEETGGDNYDLAIAERLLIDAAQHLINATPACEKCAVIFLGDLIHVDGYENLTPASKNLLDMDGRFPKIVRATMRSMRRLIELAAQRHGKVTVIVEAGNHDPASSIFLAESLAHIYEKDQRIAVNTSPQRFHYLHFGQNLVGVHHGNSVKPEELPLLMASDQSELWGKTKYRTWMTGHVHSRKVIEKGGCIVESFRVLPPVDAWAAQKGYRSGREMQAIILHEEHGEVARHICRPSMFE